MKNDWIVANIENLGFTPDEFKAIGMTTADTQLLPMEEYLKSNYIIENPLFRGNDGTFSKDKFEKFYKEQLPGFQSFSLDISEFQFDLFDTARKPNSKIKNPNMLLYLISNPSRQTTGIAGRNEIREGELTAKELALLSKIFDTSSGKYLDTSVNDNSLFKNPLGWISQLWEDPIVYATWDDDGPHTDPITGKEVEHKKGEFRINENGEYFTETLGGRNIRGKQIVSILDNITEDESFINKYDFFDTDGFEQSVSGSIFGLAAQVAPLFIPYVGEIYSATLISRELSKALPMLSSMLDGILGTNLENNSIINTLAAKGELFTKGTTLYAQEKAFSLENLSNLIGDVATQWGQQKLIAKGISKLLGSDKLMAEAYDKAFKEYQFRAGIMEGRFTPSDYKKLIGVSKFDDITLDWIKTGEWMNSAVGKALKNKYIDIAEETAKNLNRIGADASLAYMAIISNTDVYLSLLDHGVTKGEAALFSLGSILGMYGVDRYLGLGEVFFDELADKTGKYMPNNIEKLLNPWAEKLSHKGTISITSNGKQNTNKIINWGKNFGERYVNKYLKGFSEDLKHHTTGFFEKALGEGLEEVSEELVTDLTKTLYEQLGNLGITSQNDVGSFENWKERYAMSALGGALGGGIFYGVGAIKGLYPLATEEQGVEYHIRNGKLKDYLKKVDEWEEQGKFGSKTLSTQLADDEKTYLTTDDEKQSINHYIAERVRNSLIELDGIIRGNQLDLTDDLLFENMVMSEKRFLDLRDWLKEEAYGLNYFQAYQLIIDKIVEAEENLLKAEKTKSGTINDEDLIDDEWKKNNKDTDAWKLREERLLELRNKRDLLLKLKDDFLSGDTSFYYTRKMMFALDPYLRNSFNPITFDSWIKTNHKIDDVNVLSEAEYKEYYKKYLNYLEEHSREDLTDSFNLFLELEKKIAPVLVGLEGTDEEYTKSEEAISAIFRERYGEDGEKIIPSLLEQYRNAQTINEEELQEGESEEDYKKYKEILERKNSLSREDEVFLENRKNLILSNISKVRNRVKLDIIRVLSGENAKLDPDSYRRIVEQLNVPFNFLKKELLDNFIHQTLEGEFWNRNTIIDDNHLLYMAAADKQDNGKALTEDEEELIKIHQQKVAEHNKDINLLASILPQELLDQIKNYISSTLEYNEDGSNNFTKLYDGILNLLVSHLDLKKEALNLERKSYLDILDSIIKNAETTYERVVNSKENPGEVMLSKSNIYNQLIKRIIKRSKDENISIIQGFLDITEEDELTGSSDSSILDSYQVYSDIQVKDIYRILNELLTINDAVKMNTGSEILSDDDKLNIEKVKKYLKEKGVDFDEEVNSEEKIDDITDIDKLREFDNKELKFSSLFELISPKEKTEGLTSLQIAIATLATYLGTDRETIMRALDELFGKNDKGEPNPNSKIMQYFAGNEEFKFIQELSKVVKTLNPLKKLIVDIANRLGVKDIDAEFDLIYKAIYDEDPNLFKLSIELREKFEKLSEIFNLAHVYLQAAALTASMLSPYGHNHTINQLSKSEEKLPEVSENTVYLFRLEINKLLDEVYYLRQRSANNAVNKKLRFILTDKKFTEAKLQFINSIRDKFRFTIDGLGHFDLLEGIDELDNDLPDGVRLNLIEELLYNNFHKIIKDKKVSVETIFRNSDFLVELLKNKDGISGTFVRQQSGKLDERFTYSKMTTYDKFIYLMSVLSLNTRDWTLYLKEEIESNSKEINKSKKIVPLTVQQYTARLGASLINDSTVWGVALEIAKEHIPEIEKLNIFEKSFFISGIGGAGKSRVGARYVTNYSKKNLGITEDQLYITGSTNLVRQNLKEAIGFGTIIDSDIDSPGSLTIIKLAIGDDAYKKIMDELKAVSNNPKTAKLEYIIYDSTTKNVKLNWDKLKFTDKPRPKLIISDEVTHLSSIELQILNKWAEIGCIFIGDQSQSGVTYPGGSIDFEDNFVFRTPKLGISLRDNNLQNLENLTNIADLLEEIKSLDETLPDDEYSKLANDIINKRIKPLLIRGYNGDIINGTLYVPEINKELLDKISPKATVGYLGPKDSDLYKLLKKIFGDNLSQFNNIKDIQGLEFDYVITDLDFLKDLFSNLSGKLPPTNLLVYYYNILRDFYTFISRARVGSIIKASSNLIGTNIIDKVQVTSDPIVEDLDEFQQMLSKIIDTFLETTPLNSNEEESSEEPPSEETPSEEPPSEEDTVPDEEPPSEEPPSEEPPEPPTPPSEEGITPDEEIEESEDNDEEERSEEEILNEELEEENTEINDYEFSSDESDVDEGTTVIEYKGEKIEINNTPLERITDDEEEVIDDETGVLTASSRLFPIFTTFTLLGTRSAQVEDRTTGKKYRDWAIPKREAKLRDIEIFLSGESGNAVEGGDLYLLGNVLNENVDGNPLTDEQRNDIITNFLNTKSKYERLLRGLKVAIINDYDWEIVKLDFEDYITQEEYELFKENIFMVSESIDSERDILLGTDVGVKSDDEKNRKKINPALKSGKALKYICRTNDGSKTITLGLGLDVHDDDKIKYLKAQFATKLEKKLIRYRALLEQEQKSENAKTEESKAILEKYRKKIENLERVINILQADSKDSSIDKFALYVNEEVERLGEVRVLLRDTFFPSRLLSTGTERNLEDMVLNEAVTYSEYGYICIKQPPGINQNMVGRVVIFGSSDPLAYPLRNRLRQRYEDQKNGENGLVRMIALSAKGFHLNDLMDHSNTRYFGEIINEGEGIPVTFRELGIKFFGIFWNFRASLDLFTNLYKEKFNPDEALNLYDGWKGRTIEEKLNDAFSYIRFNENGEATFDRKPRDANKKLSVTRLIEEINNFNALLDSEGLGWFRLGNRLELRTKVNKATQFIENRNGKNYIFIHPERAKLFLEILTYYEESVFEPVFPKTKEGFLYSTLELDSLLEGKPKKSGERNTSNIRGRVYRNKKNKILYLKPDDESYKSLEEEDLKDRLKGRKLGTDLLFAEFALRTIKFYSALGFDIDRISNDGDEIPNEVIILGLTKEENITVNIAKAARKVNNGEIRGKVIGDLLRLMIHGTVVVSNREFLNEAEIENLSEKERRENPEFRKRSAERFSTTKKASDAYFQHGIFLNPIAITLDDPRYKSEVSEEGYFIPVAIPLFGFTTDAVVEGLVIYAEPYIERKKTREISVLEKSLNLSSELDLLTEVRRRLEEGIKSLFLDQNDKLLKKELESIRNIELTSEMGNQTIDELINDKMLSIVKNIIINLEKEVNLRKIYFIDSDGKIKKILDKVKEIYPGNKELFDNDFSKSRLFSENRFKRFNVGNHTIEIIFNNDGSALIDIKSISETSELFGSIEESKNTANEIANEIVSKIESFPEGPLSGLLNNLLGPPSIKNLQENLIKFFNEILKTTDIDTLINLVLSKSLLELDNLTNFDPEDSELMDAMNELLSQLILKILGTKTNEAIADPSEDSSLYDHLINELNRLKDKGSCSLKL